MCWVELGNRFPQHIMHQIYRLPPWTSPLNSLHRTLRTYHLFSYFILFFYLWLIFAERFARSVHSPSHCTLRPRTCALLGWCYYRTKFGSAWSLKWKTFSIWTLPISSSATWWEVNTGVNTWCASCYLLMPQWALKSPLLMVDLLHYINRYWRRFFFFFFLISRKDSYFPRNICGRCLCLHSQ